MSQWPPVSAYAIRRLRSALVRELERGRDRRRAGCIVDGLVERLRSIVAGSDPWIFIRNGVWFTRGGDPHSLRMRMSAKDLVSAVRRLIRVGRPPDSAMPQLLMSGLLLAHHKVFNVGTSPTSPPRAPRAAALSARSAYLGGA